MKWELILKIHFLPVTPGFIFNVKELITECRCCWLSPVSGRRRRGGRRWRSLAGRSSTSSTTSSGQGLSLLLQISPVLEYSGNSTSSSPIATTKVHLFFDNEVWWWCYAAIPCPCRFYLTPSFRVWWLQRCSQVPPAESTDEHVPTAVLERGDCRQEEERPRDEPPHPRHDGPGRDTRSHHERVCSLLH